MGGGILQEGSFKHFVYMNSAEKVCGEGEDSAVQDEDPAVVAGNKGEYTGYESYSMYVALRHPRTQRG